MKADIKEIEKNLIFFIILNIYRQSFIFFSRKQKIISSNFVIYII